MIPLNDGQTSYLSLLTVGHLELKGPYTAATPCDEVLPKTLKMVVVAACLTLSMK